MLEKSFEQFNAYTLPALRKLSNINDVNLQESVDQLDTVMPVNLVNDIPCSELIISLLTVIGKEQYCDEQKIFKEEQINAVKAAVEELEVFNLILRNEEYELERKEENLKIKERLPFEEVLDKVVIKDRLPNIK
jgi:hypothetical protein